MYDPILRRISDCVVNIEPGNVRGLIREAVEKELPPYEIFMGGLSKGMDLVGQRYEAGEYFLTELLGAADIMNEAIEELGPHLRGEATFSSGKVVLGTVEGDIHDIGKNIVKMLMTSAGFSVYDLRTDVSAQKFKEKAEETEADIVAISTLLMGTMHQMRLVIDSLEKSNLRGKLKVIIGGAPITDEFAGEIGADAAAKDAAHGVRLCKEWTERDRT